MEVKAPRSEVKASLRDLTSGSNRLPWTGVIFFGVFALDHTTAVVDAGVVFSKVVNNSSGRVTPKHVIAAKVVAKRRGVGGVGRPANGIGPVRTASSGGASSSGATGSVVANGKSKPKQCQLPYRHRARASAQRPEAKRFAYGRVIGRAATCCSRCRTGMRRDVFVAWLVAWRYGVCWIVKPVIAHADNGDDGQHGPRLHDQRTLLEGCLCLFL